METQLQTTKEVATILGTNPKTLSNWRTAGIGPRFVKIGSHVRYRTSDLDAWLESRTVKSTSEAAVL